nr:MAG TPA_asm: hypothetical protein [Caudoviricetes sp.]
MRNKLTSWGVAFRKRSNQLILAAGLVQVWWLTVPEDWKRVVIDWKDGSLIIVSAALSAAAFLYSNIRQPSIEQEMKKAYDVPTEDDG